MLNRSRVDLNVVAILVMFALSSVATASNSGITYQGRILKPDGTVLSGVNAQFKLQIRTPDSGSCLMYEELQAQDMSKSNGAFSLTINDGSGSRTDSTGLTLDKIFANHGSVALDPTTCSAGSGTYTPGQNDGRNLVVLFKDETMATWEPIPAQKINFVPFAFEAKQVAGFTAGSLVRVAESDGTLDLVSPLSNAQYATLLGLANGTSTAYTAAGTLNGSAMPSMTSGQVLGWNGSAWVSTSATPAASSITQTMLQNNIVSTNQMAGDVTINTTGSLGSAITTTRDFKIYAASPGTGFIEMKAPAIPNGTSYTLTWPLTAGAANQVLTTDGSGGLSWAAPAVTTQWTTHGSNISYDGGGNVGIGTTAPAAALDLASGSLNMGAVINTGTGVSTGDTAVELGQSRTGAGNAYIDLHTQTGSDFDMRLIKGPGISGAAQLINTGDGSSLQIWNSGNSPLQFGTYNAERMRIDGAGNVGIGTTSPSGTLDVEGGTIATANTGGQNITLQAQNANGNGVGGSINLYPGSGNWGAGNVYISKNMSTPVLVINRAANDAYTPASASASSPNGRTLQIGGGFSFDGTAQLISFDLAGASGQHAYMGAIAQGSSTSAAPIVFGQTTGASSYAERVRIDSSGNVGIGTTAPATKLQVAGSVLLGNGAEACGATYAGAIRYNTSSFSVEICNGTGWLVMSSGSGSGTINASTIQNSAGGITLSPAASSGVVVGSTLASTSPTTGSLITNGGLGVSGAIYSSDLINSAASITAATTMSAGTSLMAPQIYGSSTASGNIKIDGTSNAATGNVLLASAGGFIGIGTTAPLYSLDIHRTNGSAIVNIQTDDSNTTNRYPQIAVTNYLGGSTAGVPALTLYNSRGNTTTSAPVSAGDKLGLLAFRGSNSTTPGSYNQSATISAVAEEAFGASAGGTYLTLNTMTTGTATLAERMRITGSGNVGIGTTAPDAKLVINANTVTPLTPNSGSNLHISGADGASSAITLDAFGAQFYNSPYVTLRKAQGTAASPGTTALYDIMGSVQFQGYQSGFVGGASVTADATENWTASAKGTRVTITGTKTGTTTAISATLAGNGLGINTTNPVGQLGVGGNVSTTSWTTAGQNFNVANNTMTDTSGSGTTALRVANSFGVPTLTSTSAVTLTNAANLYIAGAPSAGTNTTITNAQALYVAGGNSYFGGNVGIGTTAPVSSVDVNGAISIKGLNGIRYPASDSTVGASIAIGPNALASQDALATTAFNNIAIGYQSLSSASLTTTAINNVAIGYQAMAANTNRANLVAVGYQAMNSVNPGISSTAVGASALFKATGDNNVAVGTSAGANVGGGFRNTFVGTNAVSSGNPNEVVAIGTSTGANVSGANNTLLGTKVASTTLTNGTGNILIGNSAAVDTPTATTSNFLNIGNAIFATGMTGTLAAPAGNVGIGTTAPQAMLDVNGMMHLKANASAPVACSSTYDNNLAITSHHTQCICNGGTSTWVTVNDGTTTCTW